MLLASVIAPSVLFKLHTSVLLFYHRPHSSSIHVACSAWQCLIFPLVESKLGQANCETSITWFMIDVVYDTCSCIFLLTEYTTPLWIILMDPDGKSNL